MAYAITTLCGGLFYGPAFFLAVLAAAYILPFNAASLTVVCSVAWCGHPHACAPVVCVPYAAMCTGLRTNLAPSALLSGFAAWTAGLLPDGVYDRAGAPGSCNGTHVTHISGACPLCRDVHLFARHSRARRPRRTAARLLPNRMGLLLSAAEPI